MQNPLALVTDGGTAVKVSQLTQQLPKAALILFFMCHKHGSLAPNTWELNEPDVCCVDQSSWSSQMKHKLKN